MTEHKNDPNQRCTVCGKSGPLKACKSCVAKYGQQYDLDTPDGRFQARQKEQGSPYQRDRLRFEKVQAERESILAKITEKLNRAQDAVRDNRYQDIAVELKGIERMAKKINTLMI